jgi:hypothetical protein
LLITIVTISRNPRTHSIFPQELRGRIPVQAHKIGGFGCSWTCRRRRVAPFAVRAGHADGSASSRRVRRWCRSDSIRRLGDPRPTVLDYAARRPAQASGAIAPGHIAHSARCARSARSFPHKAASPEGSTVSSHTRRITNRETPNPSCHAISSHHNCPESPLNIPST